MPDKPKKTVTIHVDAHQTDGHSVPVNARRLTKHFDDKKFDTHKKRLASITPIVNTDEPKSMKATHQLVKLKPMQMEIERKNKVQKENRMLLEKMWSVMTRSNSTLEPRRHMPATTQKKRQDKLDKITRENSVVMQKLILAKPSIDRYAMKEFSKRHDKDLAKISKFPPPKQIKKQWPKSVPTVASKPSTLPRPTVVLTSSDVPPLLKPYGQGSSKVKPDRSIQSKSSVSSKKSQNRPSSPKLKFDKSKADRRATINLYTAKDAPFIKVAPSGGKVPGVKDVPSGKFPGLDDAPSGKASGIKDTPSKSPSGKAPSKAPSSKAPPSKTPSGKEQASRTPSSKAPSKSASKKEPEKKESKKESQGKLSKKPSAK